VAAIDLDVLDLGPVSVQAGLPGEMPSLRLKMEVVVPAAARPACQAGPGSSILAAVTIS